MKRDYKLFIKDIKESIKQIEEYTKNISEEQFKRDIKIQDAVIRRFEIIGEASKNIPRSVREINPNINWKELSQFRDFITHSYFEASLNRIWGLVVNRIPKIKENINKIKLL
ncbi:MAG: DUF86 domain-containing protein [Nanoarchaeota archaeon]|nr:DUF86 domain-containing protein [Nanoarchaeota archaeon]